VAEDAAAGQALLSDAAPEGPASRLGAHETAHRDVQGQGHPEPETLWDDYATRPTALPINEQTVARDLTRRDLKLTPPADLKGPALQKWMNVQADGTRSGWQDSSPARNS
jgi:hypothetical protein